MFVFVLIYCCLFFVFLFLSVPVLLRLVFSCFWFCFIWLFFLYASLLVVDVDLFLCVWQSLRDLFAFDIGFPSFRSFVRVKVGQSVKNFARSFRGTIHDWYYKLLIYHD